MESRVEKVKQNSTMSCKIGQNIYKLRKKNKELLEQLETNSALLQNKIKMLRHAARSPKKSSTSKDEQLSSPLKRKHENWNARNNSCHVAASLIKAAGLKSSVIPEVDVGSKDCIPDKKCIKKTPAKRVKSTNVTLLKSEVKKPLERQVKGRWKISLKKAQEINSNCYCGKNSDTCVRKSRKTQSNCDRLLKPRSEFSKITKCSKLHVDKDAFKENEDDENISVCPKNLDEARNILNYSPESMFLRRIKQRLLKSDNKDNNEDVMTNVGLCDCENNEILSPDPGNNCPHSRTCEWCCKSDFEHIQNHNEHDKNNDNAGEQSGDLSSPCKDKIKNSKQDCFVSNKMKCKSSKIETCKEYINTSTQVSPKTFSSVLGEQIKCKTHRGIQVEEPTCKKNIINKYTHGKSITPKTAPNTCLCKKQLGGLCCCEVIQPCNKVTHHHCPHGVRFCSGLKSSISAPDMPHAKSSHPAKPQKLNPLTIKNDTDQQKIRCPCHIHSTGYDVIAGLVDNDLSNFSSDPCAYQLEELSHFRQKHWFDCHAHPHSMNLKSPENINVSSLDDDNDLMQPTIDPCIRSYRLNKRLFPKAVAEAHNAECCIAGQKGCISPRLLPNQRRLVTLPTVSQRSSTRTQDTLKPQVGVSSFPEPNILISNPPTTTNQPHSASVVKQYFRRPVPSNSLALRFQKGVS